MVNKVDAFPPYEVTGEKRETRRGKIRLDSTQCKNEVHR